MLLLGAALLISALVAGLVVVLRPTPPDDPGVAHPTDEPMVTPGAITTSPPPEVPRIMFGVGPEADTAVQSRLVREAPVRMLTSWYNGPGDLAWMDGWRTRTVPESYAAGFALHLIVYANDAEQTVPTSWGQACGRGYPLSTGFLDDMRRLATIFAGSADGPPLYVTLFTEFQTYPCTDNAFSPDPQTTAYYQALQAQYLAAYDVFHAHAANAHVSLGWGGWQASFDEPHRGGGRSLFAHFDPVLRQSDFQSFQSMNSNGNIADIRAMVEALGPYGPVMLAHYKPDNGSMATFITDVSMIFTDAFLAELITGGLFAVSLMDTANIDADETAFGLVHSAVTRYGRGWDG